MDKGLVSAPMTAVPQNETATTATHRGAAEERRRARARLRWAVFARNFIRHPLALGTMFPSSPALIDRALSHFDWAQCRTVVEYGPGVGHFTAALLERLHPDAELLAIEIVPEFVKVLRESFDDPRLRVFEGSAGDVRRMVARTGRTRVDGVISGLPFSTLSRRDIGRIVSETHAALEPGGTFVVYQLSSAVEPYLRAAFGTVETEREWLNLPPAKIFTCRREAT